MTGEFWLVWSQTIADPTSPAHPIFMAKVGKPSADFPGQMRGQTWTGDPAKAHRFKSLASAQRANDGDRIAHFPTGASPYNLRFFASTGRLRTEGGV